MEYLSVAEARDLPGLRLALTAGAPAPWSIAARALFDIRKVPYVPVRQKMMSANEELVAWTGRRNAPVAVYGDEPALDNWLDILMLAERLGSGLSLLPEDPVERALAVGFSAEICGHGGFGWSRRLIISSGSSTASVPEKLRASREQAARVYGIRPDAVATAPGRVIGILRGLSRQLHRQADAGSGYLVGDRLAACDVHWACFSQMVAPLSEDICPATVFVAPIYGVMPDEVAAEVDPILIEHRDRIFRDHIGSPLDC